MRGLLGGLRMLMLEMPEVRFGLFGRFGVILCALWIGMAFQWGLGLGRCVTIFTACLLGYQWVAGRVGMAGL